MESLARCVIRYNHVGYGTRFLKIFYVAMSRDCPDSVALDGAPFEILKENGESVYSGTLSRRGNCDYTDEILFEGNFSAVIFPGRYKIAITGENLASKPGQSCFFEIGDDWILSQMKANIKSFYYQRSGVELPKEFAGAWARPAAHLDDSLEFHSIMNRKGLWNAHGGWYDAGDYGKYIVNGGVSVGSLLLAPEMLTDAPSLGTTELDPRQTSFLTSAINGLGFESAFEQPFSLIEEIRFELDFFFRMQDEDGGVFFKVTPGRWDGFVTPKESDSLQKRFIMGKSTTSTLNFAGVMAQAHGVFKRISRLEKDPVKNEYAQYAKRCLNASLKAYRWALANPKSDYPHNTEGSGGYGDDRYDDEFFWTRAALFREFVQNQESVLESFKNIGLDPSTLYAQILSDLKINPLQYGVSWRDTQNMGWFLLALNPATDAESTALRKIARSEMERIAGEILKLQGNDPYGISIRKFVWGSNGEMANHALTLLVAYHWTRDNRYRNGALELLNFIYGRNPVGTSFVTGSAFSSPKFPHHRISHSDGIETPVPGLLVGGINSDRQDMHRDPHYPGKQAGFSYTDERCSFASNETAINWNAPLTVALALIAQSL